MKIHPSIVKAARTGWNWEWNQLMNGLAPCDSEGNYIRPKSKNRKLYEPCIENLEKRSKENLPTLIIGKSCPWAHRTWLVYKIKKLENKINLIIVNVNRNEGLWKFQNNYLGCSSLYELYKLCGESPSLRATVPTLIDPISNYKENKPRIIGNESSQLVKILNRWPNKENKINLEPKESINEIEKLTNVLQENINNGVYKCGFARNQSAYNDSSNKLFNTISNIEDILKGKGPWLCGEKMTLADIYLFPTLIRWEMVYSPLFRCTKIPLWKFPKIWEWRRNFLKVHKVSDTCDSEAWRDDYFGALFPLQPSNIVPSGPILKELVDSSPPN